MSDRRNTRSSRRTGNTVPDERHWVELEAVADAWEKKPERVGSLEQTTCQIQGSVQGLAQRQEVGASGAENGSNSLAGRTVVPDSSWRKGPAVQGPLECAETREPMAPISAPDASGIFGAGRLGHHAYASLLLSTEAWTEAHSIMDHAPGKTKNKRIGGAEDIVQCLDPASAQANLNLTSRILKPPKGNVDSFPFLIEKWEDKVRRQDWRTGREFTTRSGQS